MTDTCFAVAVFLDGKCFEVPENSWKGYMKMNCKHVFFTLDYTALKHFLKRESTSKSLICVGKRYLKGHQTSPVPPWH